jgi:hypothetical protein
MIAEPYPFDQAMVIQSEKTRLVHQEASYLTRARQAMHRCETTD